MNSYQSLTKLSWLGGPRCTKTENLNEGKNAKVGDCIIMTPGGCHLCAIYDTLLPAIYAESTKIHPSQTTHTSLCVAKLMTL